MQTGSINSLSTQTTNMSSSDISQNFPQRKRVIPPPMPIDLVSRSYFGDFVLIRTLHYSLSPQLLNMILTQAVPFLVLHLGIA